MRPLLLALVLVACGGTEPTTGARCEIGRSQPCACVDGGTGAQECSPAGVYGACACVARDAGSDAAPADVAPMDGPLDAPACSSERPVCECPDGMRRFTTCAAGVTAPCPCAAMEAGVDASADVAVEAACTSGTSASCCGAACVLGANASSVTCEKGRCSSVCTGLFADCDGNARNGCEADTASDPANCGACAAPCGSNALCAGSSCSACRVSFGDCDGNRANGCEAHVPDDTANCGTCGHRCPERLHCMDYLCQL